MLWHFRLPTRRCRGRRAAAGGGRGGGARRHESEGPRGGDDGCGISGFRVDGGIGGGFGNVFNTHERVRQVAKPAKRCGKASATRRLDASTFTRSSIFADALRFCRLIEEYEPYFVEDPMRDEHFLEDIPKLRKMTTCPLAAGEEWGQRWNFNPLVEHHDIDYIRATLPNVGGITEMMKIAALCETHPSESCRTSRARCPRRRWRTAWHPFRVRCSSNTTMANAR